MTGYTNIRNYNYQIELIKLLAATVISLLHFNYEIVPQGYLCVELFLIVGGYYTYKKRSIYQSINMFDILLSKLKRVGGYWIFIVTTGWIIAIFKYRLPFSIWISKYLLVLLGIPYVFGDISMEAFWEPFPQLWYIPIWILASYICIVLIKFSHNEYLQFILLYVVVLGVVFNGNVVHTLNITIEERIGLFSFAFYRGLHGYLLGIIARMIHEHIHIKSHYRSALITITSICGTFIIVTKSLIGLYDYIFCFVMVIQVIAMNEDNMLSSLLNKFGRKVLSITKLSVPIYFIHGLWIVVFDEFNLSKNSFVSASVYIILVVITAELLSVSREIIQEKYLKH